MGIDYNDARTHLGFIPEFEEREAAMRSGNSWREWEALPVLERAAVVGHMRLSAHISAHTQAAVARDRERRQKQQKRGRH